MKAPIVTPPAWFSVQHPVQEDTIDSVQKDMDDVEVLRRQGIEQMKAEALPYMAEVVRDLDSRIEAGVRGGLRLWTREAWERVMGRKGSLISSSN